MKIDIEHISDELLARYLSGKATPEEAAAVLDYFSESDERLDDLLAMSAAIGLNSTQRKRPLWSIISVAASVVLIIGIGIALWLNDKSGAIVGIDPAPVYATQDSLVETNLEDTL